MRQRKSEKPEQSSFAWLLGQAMLLPFTAFTYSLEMFVKTFQEIQRVADNSVGLLVGNTRREGEQNPGCEPEMRNADSAAPVETQTAESATAGQSDFLLKREIDNENEDDENKRRARDRDLRDDLLKLVRYKVLFVKREYEHAFAEQEELIAENLDAASFAAWKAAEFTERLAGGTTKIPEKWLMRNYPPRKYRVGAMLKGLPEEDKKYLRVFYEIIERYPREKFKFEEQQIEVLGQIRDNIKAITEPEEESEAENKTK